jgi:transcriptional regulator with XRE-family HTH domain
MPKKKTLSPEILNYSATAILSARISAGVSQRDLSVRMGITQPLISAWEHGKSVPSLHHLVAIETSLGLSTGELIMPIAYPTHHGDLPSNN